ncbi:hypothetical protein Caci_6581 [Catenulispora acidiphila DSM 44928]|uniref:Uncharacterized protein n=1 Tax=Catenulispora acidiphila (strain DSM 44928 / JCM 14897 / NBRC 102108 / NRRL B-24433 / ID139908) TaxID=479433 RepID=C7PYD7_CATAD|nr:CATRA conflict system CASPASE/TPR repeat-associated protein [Catenulispora acidiphila]ACU75427.1 hypothetical protein Caci_6581 [Catenulispora acidiphila DSM 44928]
MTPQPRPSPSPTAQALAVHVFFSAEGEHARASYARLRDLWTACGDSLGMTTPVPRLGMPVELPPTLAAPSVLGPAAARQSVAEGIVQAFVVRERDVYCLAVMIAPDAAERLGWSELEARWSAVVTAGASAGAGTPNAVPLGEARLFLALVNTMPDGVAAPSGVREAMPQHPDTDEAWWRRGHRTDSGLLLWETASRPDDRAVRRFAVVASRRDEKLMDAWVWTRGEAEVPPFGRYLMHMAKIRHELRIHAGGDAVRRLRTEADSRVERLLQLLEGEIPAGPAELVAASTRLAVLRVQSAGLIAALTRLREMRRTVQIAQWNMAAALGEDGGIEGQASAVSGPGHIRARASDNEVGGPVSGRPGTTGSRPGTPPATPLTDDRALADWFATRLDDDALYVAAACDRTRDVAEITATVVEHGLHEHRQAAEDHRDRFSLLQTAIIGAVLMVLTAVQALGYRVPVSGPVKAPLVAVLGAVTLFLAAFVLRLATASDHRPQALLSHIAAGLSGAALVWLLVAIGWTEQAHHSSPRGLTCLVSGFGFVVGVAVARLLSRRGLAA